MKSISRLAGNVLVGSALIAMAFAVVRWASVSVATAGPTPSGRVTASPQDERLERPSIAGLAHVAFRVNEMDAARRFYGEVLGLEEARAGLDPDRTHFPVSYRQEIIIEAGLAPDEDERLAHLAFETTDLERLAAYLKVHDVTTDTEGPSGARCVSESLWVTDPDGHPIEFVERQTRGASGPPSRSTGRGASSGTPAVSNRILHAGLTVRDADAADRFYATVLGFSEIWRGGQTEAVTSWINMKVPDGTDYLEYMLIEEPVGRRQLGVLHHVALLVPDIQVAYETVLARTASDAEPIDSPQLGRNDRWQLNLYDPDGTRVELMEPFTIR